MSPSRQVLTIVAMDVVGSSQLGSDREKARINSEIGTILSTLAPKHGATVAKHNGDGFIVGGHDPLEMAELALEARHHFRTTNWKKLGLNNKPTVRIGINTGPVEIVNGNEFSGRNVEVACRIEPITDPDSVWCSPATVQFLKDETDRISYREVGERTLAKNYGKLSLSSLSWAHEAAPSPADEPQSAKPVGQTNILQRIGIGIPGIKRDFSDAERLEFVERTFTITRDTFIAALKLMEERDPGIVKTHFRSKGTNRFECSVAVQGKTRANLSVWLVADGWRSECEIRASTSSSITNDNCYNYSLSVSDTGYQLVMTAGFAFHSENKNMSPEQAAQLLWDELTKQLI